MKKAATLLTLIVLLLLFNSCKKKSKDSDTPTYGEFNVVPSAVTYIPQYCSSFQDGNTWKTYALYSKKSGLHTFETYCDIYTGGRHPPAIGTYTLKPSSNSLSDGEAYIIFHYNDPEGGDGWECFSNSGTLTIKQFGAFMKEADFNVSDGTYIHHHASSSPSTMPLGLYGTICFH